MAKKKQEVAIRRVNDKGVLNLENLSKDELKKYEQIGDSLIPKDVNSILSFGKEISTIVEKNSDNFLNTIRVSKAGETGEIINELLSELNYIDIEQLETKGIMAFFAKIPFFKKLAYNMEKLLSQYDSIVGNIDKISSKVKDGRINAIKDNNVLEISFNNTVEYIKKSEDYIIAGTLKLQELMTNLQDMKNNPDSHADYEIRDAERFINRLDSKLTDLKMVRAVFMQKIPQIRMIQDNNIMLADKAESIITTLIPSFKDQVTLAVALQRQKAGNEVQGKVIEAANTILMRNADTLHENTVNIRQQQNNTLISMDTLRHTNKKITETIHEMKELSEKSFSVNRQIDEELSSLEGNLRRDVKELDA